MFTYTLNNSIEAIWVTIWLVETDCSKIVEEQPQNKKLILFSSRILSFFIRSDMNGSKVILISSNMCEYSSCTSLTWFGKNCDFLKFSTHCLLKPSKFGKVDYLRQSIPEQHQ